MSSIQPHLTTLFIATALRVEKWKGPPLSSFDDHNSPLAETMANFDRGQSRFAHFQPPSADPTKPTVPWLNL